MCTPPFTKGSREQVHNQLPATQQTPWQAWLLLFPLVEGRLCKNWPFEIAGAHGPAPHHAGPTFTRVALYHSLFQHKPLSRDDGLERTADDPGGCEQALHQHRQDFFHRPLHLLNHDLGGSRQGGVGGEQAASCATPCSLGARMCATTTASPSHTSGSGHCSSSSCPRPPCWWPCTWPTTGTRRSASSSEER